MRSYWLRRWTKQKPPRQKTGKWMSMRIGTTRENEQTTTGKRRLVAENCSMGRKSVAWEASSICDSREFSNKKKTKKRGWDTQISETFIGRIRKSDSDSWAGKSYGPARPKTKRTTLQGSPKQRSWKEVGVEKPGLWAHQKQGCNWKTRGGRAGVGGCGELFGARFYAMG